MKPVSLAVFLVLLYAKIIDGFASLNYSDVNSQNSSTELKEKDFLLIHNASRDNVQIIMYEKNLPSQEGKKVRREKIRKRKEKTGRSRKKLHKSFDYIDRNNEKIDLVHNRTVEILRKGIRILDAQEKPYKHKIKTSFRVNNTSIKKILGLSLPNQNILSSVSGIYTLPIGFDIPRKESKLSINENEELTDVNKSSHSDKTLEKFGDVSFEINGKAEKTLSKASAVDFSPNNNNDNFSNDYESLISRLYGSENSSFYTDTIQEQMKIFLKNLTDCSKGNCLENTTRDSGFINGEDPCLKWLHCKKKLHLAFLDEVNNLPSCPCTYPSSIFYNDSLWDNKLQKYFKWRDASGEGERINIYKPGAAHCIRSRVVQGVPYLSSQHCCYDRSLLLLTRGSGAGTVNFVSPDASKALHFALDILPWRLCKGDFTRYNAVRIPNNGNNCPENPNDKLYELEVKLSQNY